MSRIFHKEEVEETKIRLFCRHNETETCVVLNKETYDFLEEYFRGQIIKNDTPFEPAIIFEKDLLTTALEGGSNHWYLLKNVPSDERYGMSLVDRLWAGMSLFMAEYPVYDLEEPSEKLGVINMRRIKLGSKLMKKYHPERWAAMQDDHDADDADTWLQYVVMGEVVFG